MDRQQMQGQVYNTPGVTAPAKPALTEAGVEAEKTGTNGDVVQLGDSKPAAENAGATDVRATGSQYTDNTGKSDKTGIVDAAKPDMPGLQQGKIKGLEGVDTSPKNMKEWFGWYDEQRRRMGLETEADREKRERRENAERMIAAIGDGVSALAQIHAASKGAVVNPGTGTTLSEGVAKRLERLRQQRDANENKVLNLLRQRKQDELAEKRVRRDEQRAEQAAKHQAAQERYWDEQAKRWANADEVARQRAEEQARANKAREEETKRNHDMTEKGKNDRAAASRAAANSRAAKAEAGRQSRYNQTRADKQAKDQQGGRKSPTGGSNQQGGKKKIRGVNWKTKK